MYSPRSILARPLLWPPRYPELWPLRSGLVGWWPFDQRSGKILRDRSGKRNDGTIYGATWVPNGLSFNGTSNYVQLPNFNTSGSFTISVRVKLNELNRLQYLTEKESSTRYEGTIFIDSANKFNFYIKDDTTGLLLTSASAYGLGTYEITAVRDRVAGKLYLYVNGTSAATPITDTLGDITNTVARQFGAGNRAPTGRYFNGVFFSALIFDNRALNATEVKRLYEMTKSYVMGG